MTKYIINFEGANGFESVELSGEALKSLVQGDGGVEWNIAPNVTRAIPVHRIYDLIMDENE